MKQAVEIYNDDPRTGTFIISRGFERDHHRVLDLVKKYEKDFLELENKPVLIGLIKRRVPGKKAGRPIIISDDGCRYRHKKRGCSRIQKGPKAAKNPILRPSQG